MLRWLRIGKWLLVILLVLVLLPELVRLALIQASSRMGFGDATIDDVDLNLFEATAAIKGVTLRRDNNLKLGFAALAIDVSWLKLLGGVIDVERLSLEGAQLAVIELASGQWEVVMPLSTGAEEVPAVDGSPAIKLPKLDAELLRLTDVEITVDSQQLKGLLEVDQLQLERLSSWQNQQVSLALSGRWNHLPLALDLIATPLATEPRISGHLQLERFNLADLALIAGRPLTGELQVNLNFEGVRSKSGEVSSVIDGNIVIDQLSSGYRQLTLAGKALSWQGQARAQWFNDTLSYTLQGEVLSEGLNIQDQQQRSLLAWNDFTVNKMSIDQLLNLSVDSVQIKGLDVNNKTGETGRFYTGEVALNSLSLLEGRKLSVDEVIVTDAQYELVVLPTGQLQLDQIVKSVLTDLGVSPEPSPQLAESLGEDATEPPGKESVTKEPEMDESLSGQPPAGKSLLANDQATPTTSAITLAIKQFVVQGDSYINVTDQRFATPVKQQLHINKLSVVGLNQADSDAAAQLNLKGSLGEFSAINISGEVKPFGPQLALQLTGEVAAIELPAISPYSEAYLGYNLTRGQYDHQFELQINQGEIQWDNSLKLRQLSLKSVDPDKPQPMAKQLDMPLAFALDMLRDGNDDISLEVPIKGRLDEIKVGLSDIVNAALGNAVKAGATSYLTLALQPYGAVLMAANFVGDKLSAIQLEPIVFAAGVVELNSQQLDYIEKITGLLQQRPKLSLTLCASANNDDQLQLQTLQPEVPVAEAALQGMADQRGKAVKRQLLTKGIESRRVYLCQPSFKPESASAVTLAM